MNLVMYQSMAKELKKIAQYGPFTMPIDQEIDQITQGSKGQEARDKLQAYHALAQERAQGLGTAAGAVGGALLGGGIGAFAGGSRYGLIGAGLGAGVGALGAGVLGNWVGRGLDSKNDAIRAEIDRRERLASR